MPRDDLWAGAVTAFLAPMPTELRPLTRAARLRRAQVDGRPVRHGRIGSVPVVGAVGGIGTTAAATTTGWLLDHFAVARLVVIGVAGGVDPGLRIGDLVVPASVIDTATGRRFQAHPFGGVRPAGTISTSDEPFAAVAQEGVMAIDMETSAVAEVCEARGCPWLAFRGISDLVLEGLVDEAVMGLAKADGGPDLAAVWRYVRADPRRVARLARLARDSEAATTVAAHAAVRAVAASLPS